MMPPNLLEPVRASPATVPAMVMVGSVFAGPSLAVILKLVPVRVIAPVKIASEVYGSPSAGTMSMVTWSPVTTIVPVSSENSPQPLVLISIA
jgi:hypothetical protein